MQLKTLSKHPSMAAIEPALIELPKTYRSLVVRHIFKIIYRIEEETQKIIIVTIWDCRQDPTQLRDKMPIRREE